MGEQYKLALKAHVQNISQDLLFLLVAALSVSGEVVFLAIEV